MSERIGKKIIYKKYNAELIQSAVTNVRTKQKTIHGAAMFYNIPRATLVRHVNGKNSGKKQGKESVLTMEEKDYLVEHIINCAKIGVALNSNAIIESAQHIIESQKIASKSRNRTLTRGWLHHS